MRAIPDITSLVAEHETDFHKQQRELSVDHLLYLLQTCQLRLWCLAIVVLLPLVSSTRPIIGGFDKLWMSLSTDLNLKTHQRL